MASSNDDGPPLSLRPFPVADKQPKGLADFIARVNAQPGGFRAVTETKLQQQVAAGQVSDGAPDDVAVEDVPDDGDDAAADDPAAARLEVLRNIECVRPLCSPCAG